MTDFERDLAALDEGLRDGDPDAREVEARTRQAHLHVLRASLTGRPDHHDLAELEVDRALADVGPWADLCLLRADLYARVHELTDAVRMVERVPGLADCTQARGVLADVALQLGRYDEAEELARGLVEEERTWDHLVRLAHLAGCRGDLDLADSIYADAEDEITAKSMRAFAWVELERGRWALLAGALGLVRTHVDTAERAYTGSWRVRQARSELLTAEGDLDRAIGELDLVLASTGRPEVHQALADLHDRAGRPDVARGHREAARAAFGSSAARGEVRYLHHLVEVAGADEAVGWAQRDVELRPNHLTRAALAAALHRAGRQDEAVTEMNRALATGMRDPRLLARAAEVLGPTYATAFLAHT